MLETNFDFRFRCQVSTDSEYFGILFYYQKLLKQEKGRGKVRKMILESASDFWQPFVLSKTNRGEAIGSAIVCSHKIESKIEDLTEELDNDDNERTTASFPDFRELDFHFVTRISGNEPSKIELARYLRSDEYFSPFDKLVLSSDSFFGVTAYRESNIYNEVQIRKKINNCIKELEKHRKLLYRFFPEIRREAEFTISDNRSREKDTREAKGLALQKTSDNFDSEFEDFDSVSFMNNLLP